MAAVGGTYYSFCLVRRMALPPDSRVTRELSGGGEATLPHGLRPLAAELRVLLSSLESLHAASLEIYSKGQTDGRQAAYQTLMGPATKDLGRWLSRVEALDAEARGEAFDRGASVETQGACWHSM